MTLSDIDQVRLLVGDTDNSNLLLTADEIQAFLDQNAITDSGGGTTSINYEGAGADAAGAIAAQFSPGYDFGEDGQNFRRSQRVGHFMDLERSLRKRAGGFSARLTLAGTEPVQT